MLFLSFYCIAEKLHFVPIRSNRIIFRLFDLIWFVLSVFFFSALPRETVRRTRPRTPASREKSKTPSPLAHTAAAKQLTSLVFWPKRSCQSASRKEVQQGAVRLLLKSPSGGRSKWMTCFVRQTWPGRVWGWRVEAGRLRQSSQTEGSVSERER